MLNTSRTTSPQRAERFPHLVELAGSDPEQRFELLLDVYVDGLTQRATA